MRIKIKFYAILREMAGKKELEIDLDRDNATVREIIDAIKPEIGEKAYDKIIRFWFVEKGPRITILLNGRNIVHLDGLETKVKDGDTLDIFPPAGGG